LSKATIYAANLSTQLTVMTTRLTSTIKTNLSGTNKEMKPFFSLMLELEKQRTKQRIKNNHCCLKLKNSSLA
jgi:hypothetical protein